MVMEIKFIEKKKNRLVFEIPGATNTICNAIKDELWNDKSVSVATYSTGHPLTGTPKFILECKEDALTTLKKAIKSLEKRNKDLLTMFNKL